MTDVGTPSDVDAYGPISLEPGTVIRVEGARRTRVGLVVANLKAHTHMTLWDDGQLSRSSFGLGPLGHGSDPTTGRTWRSSLSIVPRTSVRAP